MTDQHMEYQCIQEYLYIFVPSVTAKAQFPPLTTFRIFCYFHRVVIEARIGQGNSEGMEAS